MYAQSEPAAGRDALGDGGCPELEQIGRRSDWQIQELLIPILEDYLIIQDNLKVPMHIDHHFIALSLPQNHIPCHPRTVPIRYLGITPETHHLPLKNSAQANMDPHGQNIGGQNAFANNKDEHVRVGCTL